MKGEGHWNGLGGSLLAGGILVSAVGIIHFFGKPRAERELDRALKEQKYPNKRSKTRSAASNLFTHLKLNPTLIHDGVMSYTGLSVGGSL